MQKVFDIENADDMALLWSILPDEVYKIENRFEDYGDYYFEGFKGECHIDADLILIDWHGKTEITRPIQEATEADIGKLCYFWDGEINEKFIGILRRKTLQGKYICDFKGWIFHHCRRLTKEEVSELC